MQLYTTKHIHTMADTNDSLVSLLLVITTVLAMNAQFGQVLGQTCPQQLANLNVCAPFVVPGVTTNPNSQCCNALRSISFDCICNTLRIAMRLPSQCHIPPLSCGA